jgi:hypothetical protein
MRIISEILADIGYLLLLINCIILGKNILNKTKELKVFFVYNVLMFIIQMITAVLFYYSINNLFLSHYYFIGQFILVSYFYYLLIEESFQRKIICIVSPLSLLLVGIQYAFESENFFKLNLFEIFMMSLPLIIYATFHLYNLLTKEKRFYYITTGLIIYLFGSTAVFLTYKFSASIDKLCTTKYIWLFNLCLYIVYQLFILKDLLSNKSNGIKY